jgi:epoxyqueuosine reductase
MEALLDLDEPGFRARFQASAIRRTKRSGLLRNAALVLAPRQGRAVLERASGDADDAVRNAARWALARGTAAPP